MSLPAAVEAGVASDGLSAESGMADGLAAPKMDGWAYGSLLGSGACPLILLSERRTKQQARDARRNDLLILQHERSGNKFTLIDILS